MTLNGVMTVTWRYFNEFGKRAFQLIAASWSIELIDHQESTSITHIHTVKLVCVIKFIHTWVDTIDKSTDVTYA